MPDRRPPHVAVAAAGVLLAVGTSGWLFRQLRSSRRAQRRAEAELARATSPTPVPAVAMALAIDDDDDLTMADALRWRHQALHDDLTDLANRGGLFESLELLADPPTLEGRASCAVLYADLDGFKAVNDTYGHRAGDTVLKAIAERLRHLVRPGDTVARIGGDEFVIVLDQVGDEQAALVIAERIRLGLGAPIPLDLAGGAEAGALVRVDATFGIAVGDEREASALLDRADVALYAGKRAGRNRCCLWSPALRR